MTNEEINKAVARKLGWKQDYYPASGRSPNIKFWFKPRHKVPDNLPSFCTDIVAAWEVVEHLHSRQFRVTLINAAVSGRWECDTDRYDKNFKKIYFEADTAPMAICLAFLKVTNQSK